MKYTRHTATKQSYQILIVLLILTTLSSGCASGTLPSKAASALRENIHKWAGTETAFEIVSAQKAGDDLSDPTIPTGLPSDSGQVGACPPAGESETWCVVISPAITDPDGNTISHILVQSQGRYWDAQKLLDTDRSVFEYHNCTNWETP